MMKLRIGMTLVALILIALSVGGARADSTGTGDFTISVIGFGGPYAGDTFVGTFTYDSTKAVTGITPLLSFTTDFPSWAGAALTDPGVAGATYSDLFGLNFFYAPGPIGNTNAFALFESTFSCGTTVLVGGEFEDNCGHGTYTLTTSVAAPEPGTFSLFLSGILVLGLPIEIKRRRSPSIG